MRRLSFIIIICLASLLKAESIHFDPMRGLVEVDVVINGHAKGKFGIDTGADFLYIDKTFVKNNNLKLENKRPRRSVTGVDGSSEVYAFNLRSLKIGDERLYNLDASVIDMSKIINDQRRGIPDGLIGYDVLQRFYITVDYPNRSLELDMSEPSFIKKSKLDMVPFKFKRHFILVDVTLNDSITVPMILDYCASQVFISNSLAKRLGINSKRDNISKVSLDDKVITKNVNTVVVDYTKLKKGLKGVEFEGILGASFLYRHKITVDYKRKRIYKH